MELSRGRPANSIAVRFREGNRVSIGSGNRKADLALPISLNGAQRDGPAAVFTAHGLPRSVR